MNLSPFADVPFDDKDALDDFYLVNALAHDKFAQVLYSMDLTYATYPLTDVQPYDTDWLLNHQTEHESIYTLIGQTGMPDLATVDFGDEGEFYDWHLLHKQVHEIINSVLGIRS